MPTTLNKMTLSKMTKQNANRQNASQTRIVIRKTLKRILLRRTKKKNRHVSNVLYLQPQYAFIRGGFVKHLSATWAAQQSVTKIIFVTFMNLVTPRAGARHELLFNEPASVYPLSHVFTSVKNVPWQVLYFIKYSAHMSKVRAWISQWFFAKKFFLFFKNNFTRVNHSKFIHH